MRKTHKGLAWALTLCMALSLLPTTALAAAPNAPTNVHFKVGEYYQTLPTITWDPVAGAESYHVNCDDSSGQSASSGGGPKNFYGLQQDQADTYNNFRVTATNSENESSAAATLDGGTMVVTSQSKTAAAIHNTATYNEDTYHLYTITGLPENATCDLNYKFYDPAQNSGAAFDANNANNKYTYGSQRYEINADGVLVIGMQAGNNDWTGLCDGVVNAASDEYNLFVTKSCDISADGKTVNVAQEKYTLSFAEYSGPDATQTVSFANHRVDDIEYGQPYTQTATHTPTGGSIVYYSMAAATKKINPTSGEIIGWDFYEDQHTAEVTAYAAATVNYPAAMAEYYVNFVEPSNAPTNIHLGFQDGNTNPYLLWAPTGDTWTGHVVEYFDGNGSSAAEITGSVSGTEDCCTYLERASFGKTGAQDKSQTIAKAEVTMTGTGVSSATASQSLSFTSTQTVSSTPLTAVYTGTSDEVDYGTCAHFTISGVPVSKSMEVIYRYPTTIDSPDTSWDDTEYDHTVTTNTYHLSGSNGSYSFFDPVVNAAEGVLSLSDLDIDDGDYYYLTVYDGTVTDGTHGSVNITLYPLEFVFDSREAQDLSWSAAGPLSITYGDTDEGLTATNKTTGESTITYSSSDETVATVDGTGKITTVGAGDCTITATAAATGTEPTDYRETSTSYTLTVNKKAVSASYEGTAITKPYDGTSAVKADGEAVTQLDLAVSSGLVGSDALTVKLNSPVYASTDAGTNIGITGTLSVTGTGSDNYQVTPAVTGTITKATTKAGNFEITLPSGLYVGDSVTTTITPKTGLTGMGTVTIKYNDSTTVPTAVGTYAVAFDVADGTNYTAATGLSAGSLTIYNKMTATAAATVNSDNDATLVNTGRYTVSAPAAVTGKANAYTIAIQGTSALQSYASADPNQGTGAWIGLLLTASKNNATQNADGLYWSADGSTWASLNGEAALAANDGGDGTNAFAFWMNTTANTSITRYIATDNSGSDKLELTFNFTAYTPSYSGGGGGTGTTTPAPTTSGGTATTTVTSTVKNGVASASVTSSQVTSAIAAAKAAVEKSGEKPEVEIALSGASGASATSATLPRSSVQSLVTGGIDALTICGPVASISFDAASIAAIAGAASGDVNISAAQVENSTLSDAAAQVVGNRPVYSFSVTSGGSTISQFGGAVTVSVPYTPAAGENVNAIVAYYINANGEPELMQDCHYDAKSGTLVFTTTHFSTYAVGYNKMAFSDVSDSAWYADAVSYLAARSITGGTSETTFSPDATLTRGQFITLLLRAYGIDADSSTANNFADAGNTYYTGYLAAAKRLGISNGVGDNKFAPEQAVTRQDMFTLLYNALKAIDQLPEDDSGKTLSDFTDSKSISSYAQDAMAYLVKTGVVGGNNGQLSPTNTTTRAQMAQVLYNLLSK